MKPDSPNIAYFGRDDLWKREGCADYQEAQISAIRAMIPTNSRTLLDVGCGAGRLTNRLPDRLEIHGTDISPAALAKVEHPTTLAALPDLPFDDDSFDVVLCTDVPEHLPESIYERSLRELHRVARHRVFMGVPFAENSRGATSLCGSCGSLFHINDHRRRYELDDALRMSSPGVPGVVVFTGRRRTRREIVARTYRSVAADTIGWEHAVCTRCAANDSIEHCHPDSKSHRISLLSGVVDDPAGIHPDWSEILVIDDLVEGLQQPADAALINVDPHPERRILERRGEVFGMPTERVAGETVWLERTHEQIKYRMLALVEDEGWVPVPVWLINVDRLLGPNAVASADREALLNTACITIANTRQETLELRKSVGKLRARMNELTKQLKEAVSLINPEPEQPPQAEAAEVTEAAEAAVTGADQAGSPPMQASQTEPARDIEKGS